MRIIEKKIRRKLTLVIVFFCCLSSFGEIKDTTIYTNPEIQPVFKYKNDTITMVSCKNYFQMNFRMPSELMENGYSGSLIVEVIIEKSGVISKAKVVRGMGDRLDREVLKTILKMHKWSPAIDKGKTVRCRYTLPIYIIWLYGKPRKLLLH